MAKSLEASVPAVRITHDEWMAQLFGVNPEAASFQDKYNRVSTLAWRMATQVVALDQDVILDFGFWTRATRLEAQTQVEAMGARFQLYCVNCSPDVMRARALSRNTALDGNSLHIDAATFDTLFAQLEQPAADEPHIPVNGQG